MQAVELAQGFAEALKEELDFQIEARNTVQRCGPNMPLDTRLFSEMFQMLHNYGNVSLLSPPLPFFFQPAVAVFTGRLLLLVAHHVGVTARGGNPHIQPKTPANCCRVPIYRARAVRGHKESRHE